MRPTRTLVEEIAESTGLDKVAHARLLMFGLELLVLVLIYVSAHSALVRGVRRVADQLARSEPHKAARIRTLAGLFRNTADFILGFVFLVSVLSLVGVNVAAILGTASIAGIAFGFGAQKLVKDVITGYFLLLEDQYAVGDYVTIGAISGTVEDLEMRITKVRDDDGKLYILSNGDIAQVCNHSRGPVGGSFEIGIGAQADVVLATQALEAALAVEGTSLGLVALPKVEGVSAADSAKTTLKLGFKVPPGQRPMLLVPRLRAAAREALQAAGIPLG